MEPGQIDQLFQEQGQAARDLHAFVTRRQAELPEDHARRVSRSAEEFALALVADHQAYAAACEDALDASLEVTPQAKTAFAKLEAHGEVLADDFSAGGSAANRSTLETFLYDIRVRVERYEREQTARLASLRSAAAKVEAEQADPFAAFAGEAPAAPTAARVETSGRFRLEPQVIETEEGIDRNYGSFVSHADADGQPLMRDGVDERGRPMRLFAVERVTPVEVSGATVDAAIDGPNFQPGPRAGQEQGTDSPSLDLAGDQS